MPPVGGLAGEAGVEGRVGVAPVPGEPPPEEPAEVPPAVWAFRLGRLNTRTSKEIDKAFINLGDRGKPSRLASKGNEFRFQRDSMGLCPKPLV